MNNKVSVRGRTARHMLGIANHFPVFGAKYRSGDLRNKWNQREKEWECPDHFECKKIDMGIFSMELLSKIEGKKDGVILQLHGGGYYGTFHNIYRKMAGLYNEVSAGMDVLSVDYRVAPEFPFPAALEDALAAYQWLLREGYESNRIFVVGDSAGGGLTLALCLYLRDHDMPLPRGIITMSAWTDLTKSGESYKENFDIDPIFGKVTDSLVYKEGYYKDSDPEEPYISPVNGEYDGFPPMLMQVGEYEMLLSDTLEVAKKAKNAGVTVKEHVYRGMFHVFQMGLLMYPEAKEAWVEVGRFIRRLNVDKEKSCLK